MRHDKTDDIKLAPHLIASVLDPNHYDIMKVSPAFSHFHNDAASGLRLLEEQRKIFRNAYTTAWFVETVFRWFRLMTSRTTNLAFSHVVEKNHQDSCIFECDSRIVLKNSYWQ